MDAETCVKCGEKGVFHFRALTVRTIHLREMRGERRVQGLGDFTDFFVCADCARRRLDDVLKPGKALAARLIPFAAIMLFGAVLSALFTFGGELSAGLEQWAEDGVLRLFGLAALVCGALGLFGSLRTFADTRREYTALSAEDALEQAAWAVASENAPQKSGDENLTYIPITPRTLEMKNGDLMIVYKLLPEIAKQAHERIHRKENNSSAQ